jgi:hypothetical protein
MNNTQKLQVILSTPQLQQLRHLAAETDGSFKVFHDADFPFVSAQIFVQIGNFEGVICLELWNPVYVTIAPKFHHPITTEEMSDEEQVAYCIFSNLHKLCRADKLQKEMKPFQLKYSEKFVSSDPIPSDWQY